MTTQVESPVSENTITAALITDRSRINFFPKHFGSAFLVAENALYDYMGKLCKSYSGGLWNFYVLSNGGVFAAPDDDEPMHLEWSMNWFEGDMSAEAAGIVASLFMLNYLANKYRTDRFIEKYYQLRDYALNFHPERAMIYQAID